MALYKYPHDLQQSDAPAFDEDHHPGAAAPLPGIYRCTGCGHEIAADGGEPLPFEKHHRHAARRSPIRWRLVVHADERTG
jgi:hypothetical protein